MKGKGHMKGKARKSAYEEQSIDVVHFPVLHSSRVNVILRHRLLGAIENKRAAEENENDNDKEEAKEEEDNESRRHENN